MVTVRSLLPAREIVRRIRPPERDVGGPARRSERRHTAARPDDVRAAENHEIRRERPRHGEPGLRLSCGDRSRRSRARRSSEHQDLLRVGRRILRLPPDRRARPRDEVLAVRAEVHRERARLRHARAGGAPARSEHDGERSPSRVCLQRRRMAGRHERLTRLRPEHCLRRGRARGVPRLLAVHRGAGALHRT